ncbi:MAG TPA: efflux RND transporter permease subunit, partial [Bacteroidales bacterium]|nr:efflux RND transporter permease subunit [Bacteroidales bacterium]
PRFHTVYAPQMPASNYGQLLINTVSDKATRAIVNDYRPKYSDHFVNAHVVWKILAMQPSRSPIEIRISSDSVRDIRTVQGRVEQILAATSGLGWVRNDWDQPQQNIRVNLDRDKANRMGYYRSLVATSVMMGLDGIPLTTLWEGDYPVDVLLTQDPARSGDLTAVSDQYLTSPMTFSSLPLRSIATLTPGWTEGTVVRRNGVPTLTIQVDNDPKVTASSILDRVKPQIERLALPEGVSVSYGGDFEAQQEVFVPMGIALGVSILLIFFILLIQFRKAKLALLIMSGMLMTLPGAAIGLMLMRYPFSVTAFIGITSLCGMVVRNGIILIDYARELRENQKMHTRDAAIAAGKRRMRPIFLTSAAAGVGVIPMILSRSPLWGPLGTVICFGLFFSMILTLYLMPVLYSYSYSDTTKRRGFWSLPGTVKAAPVILLLVAFLFPGNGMAQVPSTPKILTLDSCKQMALLNNRKMKEAALAVSASGQQRKEVFTNFFPKVSVSALALRSADYLVKMKTPAMNLPVWDGRDPGQLMNPTQFAYVPSLSLNLIDYMNTASVTVALPVYAGGRIRNGYRLASLGEQVSTVRKELTRDEVLNRTEELFWTLQSLRAREQTLERYQVMLDTLYRDVSVYTQSGLSQKNDLLKVQLKQNELKINRMTLENGIGLTARALCQHMGIAFDSTLVFQNPVLAGEAEVIFSDPDKLVKNRKEYQLLTKAVEASVLQKKMAAGEYLPQLSVAGAGFTYDMMESTTTNGLAMVSLSVPISDWWGGAHRIKRQKIETEKAQNSLEENAEMMVLQIRQAENEVKESRFRISVAESSVGQAAENLKISQDNYRAGTIGISDLLEAQAVFQQAMDDLTDARCQYRSRLSAYRTVTGG